MRPKSFKPDRFGYGDRSIPIHEMYATVAPASLGRRTYPLMRGNAAGVPVYAGNRNSDTFALTSRAASICAFDAMIILGTPIRSRCFFLG